MRAADLSKNKMPKVAADHSIRDALLAQMPRLQSPENHQVLRYLAPDVVTGWRELSIHVCSCQFMELPGNANVADFQNYVSGKMSIGFCKMVENITRSQTSSKAWHELRYGRITASVLWQAAHCETYDGSLTETILGAAPVFESSAMKRGKDLEKLVIEQAGRQLKIETPKEAGLFLHASAPFFGASPDALSSEACFEVKCPSKMSTIKAYKNKDGKPTNKVEAQIQLQMHLTGFTKAYLCIAPPNFKKREEIEIIEIQYDKIYIENLIKKATTFWTKAIFAKLFQQ